MMTTTGTRSGAGRVVRTVGLGVLFLLVVVVLLLWLAGSFHRKVGGGVVADRLSTAERTVGDAVLVAAKLIRVPRTESAVGTVESVHKVAVASKLLAKVIEINVRAGERVAKDSILVKLDDNDLAARREQAEAAAQAARAQRDQAKIEYDRITQLQEQGAAAKIEWDRVDTALQTAEAQLRRADQAFDEAETILGYATISSPIDGVVIDKQVEPGDTVTPGEVLLQIYDPKRMQLLARVRESLTRRLSVGQTIGVRIEALKRTCQGTVSEIVPEAETSSRTFSVKVTGPCPPGVYSGMFGRLLIPLDEEQVLVVPKNAVQQVGQLRLVYVKDGQTLRRRAVQLGRSLGRDIEVLAGLRTGEEVAVQSPVGLDDGA